MMRALLVTWAGGGNVPPAVAIAEQLDASGHVVRVLGHDAVRGAFAAGTSFERYKEAPEFADSREVGSSKREPRTPLGAFASMRDGLMLGPAERFAVDTASQIAKFRPDVVIIDFMLIGGFVAAEAAQIPAVSLMHTVYAMPTPGIPPLGLGLLPAQNVAGRVRDAALLSGFRRLWNRALPDLNRARHRLGLDSIIDVFAQMDGVAQTLVASSPAFDFGAAHVPANVSYVGLQRSNRRPAPPRWRHPRADSAHAPLVVASYSTTDQDQRDRLQRVVAALGALPVHGLVTTGPAIDPRDLWAAPNVVVEAYVDHAAVVPDAFVLISHGGHGSVLGAVTAGVPVICVPQGRDQADVAARLKATGAGFTIPPWSSANRIARAVAEVLGNTRYRVAAQAVAAAIRDVPTADPIEIIERASRANSPRKTCTRRSAHPATP